MKLSTFAYTLIILTLSVIILIYGKSILLPLVLAVMVWFLIKILKSFIKRQKLGQRLPNWALNGAAFIIIFSTLSIIGNLLTRNVMHMTEAIPEYDKNIALMSSKIHNLTGFNLILWFDDFTGDYDFAVLIKAIINMVTELFADAFMVVLYVLFLMLEEAVFMKKIRLVFREEADFKKANGIIEKLNTSINDYIALKTIISLITGTLSFVALLIIGVDYAFFWAFLIFMLNYIPTIGSLIATFFPAAMALLQTASFAPFFMVIAAVGAIQIIVGNILEPKIMGNSLNISAMVVLIALSFWGAIWGVTGMIISVPVTVMIMIIMAQFPNTKSIAIFLSENGEIQK